MRIRNRIVPRGGAASRLGTLFALGVLILASSFAVGMAGQHPQSSAESIPSRPAWKLVWSDEFSAADGSLPDPGKWTFAIGGNGWGNHELEYYTGRAANAHQQNGNLVITAARESFTGSDGVAREFTSARLKTSGKFSQTYGRFEARLKLPSGQGLWPAFWLLGDNISQVGWPKCGEIDIMELVGSAPSTILGTIHGPGYSGKAGPSSEYTLPGGSFSDGFHLFAVEWEPDVIRFYVDGTLYATRTPVDLPAGARWVFDKPFFIILNFAVGGDLPGPPDSTTVFPQAMLVDYVRVYARP